jgi:hypothetical protein
MVFVTETRYQPLPTDVIDVALGLPLVDVIVPPVKSTTAVAYVVPSHRPKYANCEVLDFRNTEAVVAALGIETPVTDCTAK